MILWHVPLQVKAEANIAFDSILQRQALLDKARQEQQLAVRFTSVLGFSARLRAFCQSRQYSQILPAYEQASALIQCQIQAVPDSHVDWGVLQTLMNQVSCANLLCKPALCTYPCTFALQKCGALHFHLAHHNYCAIASVKEQSCNLVVVSCQLARVLNACRHLLRPALKC